MCCTTVDREARFALGHDGGVPVERRTVKYPQLFSGMTTVFGITPVVPNTRNQVSGTRDQDSAGTRGACRSRGGGGWRVHGADPTRNPEALHATRCDAIAPSPGPAWIADNGARRYSCPRDLT